VSHQTRAVSFLMLILVLCLSFYPTRSIHAQTDTSAITLTARAGFDGAFRDSQWLPIRVRAENNGAAVSGRLVVRPETSGGGVLGTFSAPITLPEGAQQVIDFAISARGITRDIRIELIDQDDLVVASTTATLRGLNGQDRLYIVVSESAVGAVDLTGARVGGYIAAQAVWTPADLPNRAALLDAVDVILIDDADTGVLSADQRGALAAWVSGGGHLIVAGGTNWQATAAGLGDLLPLMPGAAQTIPSLSALETWLRVPDNAALDVETTIATGQIADDARVLVAADDGVPLLVRAAYGDGTVDYLAADALAAPLRTWSRVTDFWLTLMTTTTPALGWSMGITDTQQAISAAQILPGFDALPDVLPLCGFLFAYIALIGPINYIVLNRINRREWAWITIPVLIIAFTAFSFVIGTNLRGSEATINYLSLVRGWENLPTGRAESVVGLLSPLRTRYTLSLPQGETLRPIPRAVTGGSLLANTSGSISIDIAQTDIFAASNFIVDSSFIAPFALSGTSATPAITGEATLSYDDTVEGQQNIRGSIRNDSNLTLNDPVIMVRGAALSLGQPLEPGDVQPFELTLAGESSVSPVFRAPSFLTSLSGGGGSYQIGLSEASVIDILGPDNFSANYYGRAFVDQTEESLNIRRRQFLLSSLIDDGDGATGRGDRTFLAGWSDVPPSEIALEGAAWSAQHVTAYVIELNTTADIPTQPVVIAQDRFTWVVLEQSGVNAAPIEINFLPGESAVFRFTPLPDAVLREVDELMVRLRDINIGSRVVPIQLWNYDAQRWDERDVVGGDLNISDPSAYIGTQNAVQIRLIADSVGGGFMRIGELTVEQRGVF